QCVWACRDQLREMRLPSGERVLFTYDAFGRRVRKEIIPKEVEGVALAARTVTFLWDGLTPAMEIDSAAGTRVFVHRPGTFEPLLQAERGEVFTYVNDHVGVPK